MAGVLSKFYDIHASFMKCWLCMQDIAAMTEVITFVGYFHRRFFPAELLFLKLMQIMLLH